MNLTHKQSQTGMRIVIVCMVLWLSFPTYMWLVYGQTVTQLVRFALKAFICGRLYTGKAWARWVTIAYVTAECLYSFETVSAYGLISLPGVMLTSYASIGVLLLIGPGVAQHFGKREKPLGRRKRKGLIDIAHTTITNSKSILSFERMEGADRSVNYKKIINDLNEGVKGLDEDILAAIEEIIPDGKYIVLLKKVIPNLVVPGSDDDYFSNEQVALWGIDPFDGKPHSPKTEYYRLATSRLKNDVGYYEFLIPTFSNDGLNRERVEEYRESIKDGSEPTMISLSVLDVKEPAVWNGEENPEITSHYCLAHYLVDGHHKAYAAALEGKPLTMISFLATEQGISSAEDVEAILE